MPALSFPEVRNLNAMGEKKRNNRLDIIPKEVVLVKKELEKVIPKNRENHVLSEEFRTLCQKEQVYAVIGCTKTHSIKVISPNNSKDIVVHFFDSQTKNVLKTPESVVMTKKHGIMTTKHKRAKPLPIKEMEDSMIDDIIADIYVSMRKIIFNNKKIGIRNVLGVWIKEYPYETVPLGDFNNKHKEDILLFSAKILKKYQPSDIDKYKSIKHGPQREKEYHDKDEDE